jgi:hypothetical protein
MLYDDRFVFVNGESYRAGGRDATLLRRLADRRTPRRAERRRASVAARALLGEWLSAGWCVERFPDLSTRRRHERRRHRPDRSRADFSRRRAQAIDVRRAGRRARDRVRRSATFADWPLNEPALIDALVRWVDSSRLLVVLAHSFDELARRQLRFVDWRRQWAHVVQVPERPRARGRADPDAALVPGHHLRAPSSTAFATAAPCRNDRSI